RGEFLRLQRAQHVAQPVRAFGVPQACVVRQTGRVCDQRDGHGAAFLRTTKLNTPASSLDATRSCPVSRQKAWKSATDARSVASTRSRSPGAMPRSARLAFSTGNGQFMPFTSRTIS